jgi:hypothetical protein
MGLGEPAPPAAELELLAGDPLDRLQHRLRLGSPAAPGRRVVLVLAVTVLPLVVLTVIDGQLSGLARDTLVVGRLLIALPLLVLATAPVARAVRHAVAQCAATGLVAAEDRSRFEAALTRAQRMRDSHLALAVIVVVAFGTSLLAGPGAKLPNAGDWARSGGGALSAAGWWYAVVSLSLFDLVRLRWLWRILVWWRFLFGLSRLPLRLMPAHPDRAGGLGFLSTAASSFALLVVGLAVGASFLWRAAIQAGDATLATLKVPMAGLALAMVLLIVVPLLFFLPQLGRARRRAELEYGQLAARYTRRFDAHWLGEGERHDAELLGSGDIQSLADLQGSYDVVRQMRPIPLMTPTLVILVLAAALAMLPAIEAEIPLKEILIKVLGALR